MLAHTFFRIVLAGVRKRTRIHEIVILDRFENAAWFRHFLWKLQRTMSKILQNKCEMFLVFLLAPPALAFNPVRIVLEGAQKRAHVSVFRMVSKPYSVFAVLRHVNGKT